jgi:hypothetical protein
MSNATFQVRNAQEDVFASPGRFRDDREVLFISPGDYVAHGPASITCVKMEFVAFEWLLRLLGRSRSESP